MLYAELVSSLEAMDMPEFDNAVGAASAVAVLEAPVSTSSLRVAIDTAGVLAAIDSLGVVEVCEPCGVTCMKCPVMIDAVFVCCVVCMVCRHTTVSGVFFSARSMLSGPA